MCSVCFGTFIAWLSCFETIQKLVLMLQITVILVLFLLLYSVFNECIKKVKPVKKQVYQLQNSYKQVKKQLYQLGLNKNLFINITGLT